MKKILFIFLLLSVFSLGKPLTNSEKTEVLTQFKTFQEAVIKKDIDKLMQYISFPLSIPSGQNKSEREISKAEFLKRYKNNDSFFTFEEFKLLEVDTYNGKVNPVKDYFLGNDENGDLLLNVSADFKTKGDFSLDSYDLYVKPDDNSFVVQVSLDDDIGGIEDFYVFNLRNRKLKLERIVHLEP